MLHTILSLSRFAEWYLRPPERHDTYFVLIVFPHFCESGAPHDGPAGGRLPLRRGARGPPLRPQRAAADVGRAEAPGRRTRRHRRLPPGALVYLVSPIVTFIFCRNTGFYRQARRYISRTFLSSARGGTGVYRQVGMAKTSLPYKIRALYACHVRGQSKKLLFDLFFIASPAPPGGGAGGLRRPPLPLPCVALTLTLTPTLSLALTPTSVCRQATALEALAGHLFLTDGARLDALMEHLGFGWTERGAHREAAKGLAPPPPPSED